MTRENNVRMYEAIGKRVIDTITFMSFELEENEITTIETAELSFRIFEFDG